MKKTMSKKLQLDREVVRTLTTRQLEVVAAGLCQRDSTDTHAILTPRCYVTFVNVGWAGTC